MKKEYFFSLLLLSLFSICLIPYTYSQEDWEYEEPEPYEYYDCAEYDRLEWYESECNADNLEDIEREMAKEAAAEKAYGVGIPWEDDQRQANQEEDERYVQLQEAERNAQLQADQEEDERYAQLQADQEEDERYAQLQADQEEDERNAQLQADQEEDERNAQLQADQEEDERNAQLKEATRLILRSNN